jgi:Holliday junction resolvasome RuvABC endonuclease subunit
MVSIGIDPSLNSTGICINNDGKCKYFIITSKMTKKMKAFSHSHITYLPYDKPDHTRLEYSEKENVKFNNIINICNHIYNIILTHHTTNYNDIEVYMEGVSYGSTGSAALVDLCFLNSAIRMTLKQLGIKFTIVSPTSLKKFACANGQADKNVMIDAWKRMDTNISNIDNVKIDDLADSYFLSRYFHNIK